MASNVEVVQLSAAIGREFSYKLLAAACELPEAELQAELDKLVRAELLFQKGRLPDASYIFKHALIQDSAYQSVLKKKPQQFHHRIATVLERQFPDVAATQPELLAKHFTEAASTENAIEYWSKAGQRSQQQSANNEAISHYRRGLELVATLPESPQRDGLELSMTVPLGVAMLAARGYANPETGPVFDRARVLAERVGDPATLFYILWGMWAWRLVRSDLNECRKLYSTLLDIAAKQTDPSWTCEAHFAPEVVNYYAGDFAAS
jgi:tetratricopeptide (TPR) repeat protein